LATVEVATAKAEPVTEAQLGYLTTLITKAGKDRFNAEFVAAIKGATIDARGLSFATVVGRPRCQSWDHRQQVLHRENMCQIRRADRLWGYSGRMSGAADVRTFGPTASRFRRTTGPQRPARRHDQTDQARVHPAHADAGAHIRQPCFRAQRSVVVVRRRDRV
jgi:hypothetical protein